MDGEPQFINPENKPKKAKKSRGKPFGTGQPVPKSPGRPKKSDVEYQMEAEAKRQAYKAINAYVEIIENPRAMALARVKAADSLLNRAYGLPTQRLDVEQRVSLSDEFERYIQEINEERRRKLQSRSEGTAKMLVAESEEICD